MKNSLESTLAPKNELSANLDTLSKWNVKLNHEEGHIEYRREGSHYRFLINFWEPESVFIEDTRDPERDVFQHGVLEGLELLEDIPLIELAILFEGKDFEDTFQTHHLTISADSLGFETEIITLPINLSS